MRIEGKRFAFLRSDKEIQLYVSGKRIEETLRLAVSRPIKERGMDDLNMVVQGLRGEAKTTVEGIFWSVLEMYVRNGVLPQVTEVDQFGNLIKTNFSQ